MKRKNHYLSSLTNKGTLLLIGGACLFHTATAQIKNSANETIALPEKTIEGKLHNGLHYLLLPNEYPAHTAEFRLVMRLGSVQEEDYQKGAAHFLEHMAFAGTKHFPNRSLIEYLESLGMKYGRDINAVTGYDRTVFMLKMPINANDTLQTDSTLLILKDWLTNISFEEERTKKERGVILEELRSYDLDDDFYQLKIGQNRFSERLPLGCSQDIQSIDRKKLIEFYHKWYTPQLASIVAVGCIDPIRTEQQIKKKFSDIPEKPLTDYRNYPLTYRKGIQIQELKDTLLRNSELEIMIPHPGVIGKDLSSTYQKELGRFLVRMLGKRLHMRNINAKVSDDWYLSDTNHFVFSISQKNKKELLSVLTRLSGELYDIIKNGFCSQEIEATLRSFLENLQTDTEEKSSALWCDDFTDYILSGDRYIHHTEEMQYLKDKLSCTTSETLQVLLKEWISYQKQHTLVAYKNNSIQDKPLTVEEIQTAWDNGKKLNIDKFVFQHNTKEEIKIETPLCLTETHSFQPAQIKNEYFYKETGVSEFTLENGLRFILRPTTDESENLLVTAFGRGGFADLPAEDYHRLEGTAGYMEMGGIAAVNYDTLSAYMSQEEISLNLSISNYWHDMMGMAPIDKSQELFNLMFEKIHRPELCHQDFEIIKKEEMESIGKETLLEQLMKRDPNRMLSNRLDSLVGNAPMQSIRPRTMQDVESLNLDDIASYYSTLFGNPKGLTMVITGNFDLTKIKKQLTATFGRMKQPDTTAYNNYSVSLPQEKYVEAFPNEVETQTVLEYVFAGHYTPSLEESLTLKLMRDVLQARLLQVLREEQNIVYSPYVSLFYQGIPQKTFYFDLSASVDIKNTALSEELILKIIKKLQKEPVSQEELQSMKRSFLVTKRQVLSDDAATEWRNTLVNQVKNGEQLNDFEHYEECLKKITPESLKKAFCNYINTDRFILLYLGTHLNYIQKQ